METNTNKSLINDINNFLSIKILICFMAGILLGYFTHANTITGLIGVIVFLIPLLIIYLNKKIAYNHKYNFLNGLSFAGLWISMGILITAYRAVPVSDIYQINSGMKYGVVSQATEEKPKSYKATIQLCNQDEDRIIAYFEKDSTAHIPQYGDLIGFYSEVRYISNSGNPLEFDYQKHCAMQGIYAQAYLKTGEYQILEEGYRKDIKYWGAYLRNCLLDIYRGSGIDGQELAVLEALTLGYKTDLDDETISSFQTSGAMHILAVSGLHTGIIMLITNILLSFMDYSRKTRCIKSVIIILILWGFAAITGFSSSVCRSALMFSIMQMAQIMNRNGNTFHSLAVSAFILLIINPLLIFNVGFGLSYLAVLAIISIMPLFERLRKEEKPWLRSRLQNIMHDIWKYLLGIILVSIAAQIGTGVLSIKTFGVFPVYFIITNIIVIPLSYFIMIGAIALLISSLWTPAMELLAPVMKFLLRMLTGTVSGIEELPMSSIRDITMSDFSACMIYAIIAIAVIFIYYRKLSQLKTALIAACVLMIGIIVIDCHKNIDGQLIIYNQRKEPLYSLVSNNSMTLYGTEENLTSNAKLPAYTTARIFGMDSVNKCPIDSISDLRNLYFRINDKYFYIIRTAEQLKIMKDLTLKADYLIISGKVNIKPEEATEKFGAECVIFDSSVSQYRVARCEDELRNAGLHTHYVSRDGAFIYGDGKKVFGWY